jgi:DNA-binding XRE family transcriptional regulator
MDLESFLQRSGYNQTTLAAVLNTSSQNVNRWNTGVGKPGFEICKKLLELGMTVEELFGVEYAKMHREFKVDTSIQQIFDSPEFKANLEKAVKDLKDRGLIK